VLKKIINPEAAQEILSVARMADEIKARIKFEREVNDKLAFYEAHMERTESAIESLQRWI
jgi:hypothetical protein